MTQHHRRYGGSRGASRRRYATRRADVASHQEGRLSAPVAVLIGMPGAGKTRVGGEVAQLLGVRFTDSDEVIEHRSGMKITDYLER